mmetsp:Transcript_7201/g.21743  ORF Transcript_7201/g.21743 Transcript_7201/m.21743 type:complete len:250 (-) Transcript_7201:330-1079(-)
MVCASLPTTFAPQRCRKSLCSRSSRERASSTSSSVRSAGAMVKTSCFSSAAEVAASRRVCCVRVLRPDTPGLTRRVVPVAIFLSVLSLARGRREKSCEKDADSRAGGKRSPSPVWLVLLSSLPPARQLPTRRSTDRSTSLLSAPSSPPSTCPSLLSRDPHFRSKDFPSPILLLLNEPLPLPAEASCATSPSVSVIEARRAAARCLAACSLSGPAGGLLAATDPRRFLLLLPPLPKTRLQKPCFSLPILH